MSERLDELRQAGVLEALAHTFTDAAAARELLDAVGFPAAWRPAFNVALHFWNHVLNELDKGLVADGTELLLREAARRYPKHPVLGRFRNDDEPVTVSPSRGDTAGASRRRTLVLLLLPTVVVLPLVVLSTFLYLPTRIQLDVVTRRVAFTIGGTEKQEILNASVAFSELLVEECESLSFAPSRLEVLEDDGAWHHLRNDGEVRLLCRDPDARMRLAGEDEELGTLDRLWLEAGSQVVLAMDPGPSIDVTVELEGRHLLDLPVYGDLKLIAEYVELEGADRRETVDFVTYRVQLVEPNHRLHVTSKSRGLDLVVTPAGASDVFTRQAIPLSGVELLEEDLTGKLVTPFAADATLTYPDQPSIEKVTIPGEDLVGLEALEDFRLERIVLDSDPENGGLALRFDGIAGEIKSVDGAFRTDRRLSLFQHLRHSWRWSLAAVAALWLLTTTWGVYSAARQLRS